MHYTTSVEMYVNKAQDFRSKQMRWDSNLQPLGLETNTQPFCKTGQMIELYREYLYVWWKECVFLSCHICT